MKRAMATNTNRAQGRNVLGELDRHIDVFRLAEERAFFWHTLFFVQSIEEYELFLWLEADAEELQGDTAYRAMSGEAEMQQRNVHQEAALVHYARAAFLRGGLVSLLHLGFLPFLPAWIDELGEREPSPKGLHKAEVLFPELDEHTLVAEALQEEIAGGGLVRQLRHLDVPDQCDLREQALQHYTRAARMRRRLLGGWLSDYATGKSRVRWDEVDLADLTRFKGQFLEVQAAIERIAPQGRDRQRDEISRTFYLGMVGSGRHTQALNEQKLKGMDRSITLARTLNPLYAQRTRLLEQIAMVSSGRSRRRRERQAAEEEWLRQAQLRVQNTKAGNYVRDADFGVVQVVRRNQKSLTIETASGYRERRPFHLIIDIVPDPSRPHTLPPSEEASS